MSKKKWILILCLAAASLLSLLFVYIQFVDVPFSELLGTNNFKKVEAKTKKSRPVTADDFVNNSEKDLPKNIVRTIHLDSISKKPVAIKVRVVPQSGGSDGSQVALKVLEVKTDDKISTEVKQKISGITIGVLNVTKVSIKESQKAIDAELMLVPRPEGYFGFALKRLDSRNE